jgi:hypothetical protein
MKPKTIFLGLSIALALLIAAFLLSATTLAAEPDRDTTASRIQNRQVAPSVEEGTKSTIDALWASPWVDIATSESRAFDHNLGGDWEDYSVQVWFKDIDAGGYGVNNRAYGSLEDGGSWSGAFWRNLTGTSITVGRQPADTVADQVRVWIWPSQASNISCTLWTAIGKGSTVTVNHNLGGDVDAYVVKLWFRNTTSLSGVHQVYYGGAEAPGEMFGAYWYGLDTTQVKVYRNINDILADEFLLCVSVPDPPDWNSGWVNINPNETKTLNHPLLGGNINRYIVRMEFKSVPLDSAPQDLMGIHHYAYGGDAANALTEDAQYVGANWQNLTNHSIDVYRWANDPYANQVRGRIWLRRLSIYLPLVLRNHS